MKARSLPVLLWCVVAMLAVAALVAEAGSRVTPRHLRSPLQTLPEQMGPWRAVGQDRIMDDRTKDILRPEDYLHRNYYDNQGQIISLFVAFFSLQKEGQIIHSPRHCLPGGGWEIIKKSEVTIPGTDYRLNHLMMANEMDRMSVLYWYQGRGRVQSNEYLARVRLLWDGVWRGRTDGALVRISSKERGGASSQSTLQEQLAFAADLIPTLGRLLPPAQLPR